MAISIMLATLQKEMLDLRFAPRSPLRSDLPIRRALGNQNETGGIRQNGERERFGILSWSGRLDSDLELQFEPQHASRRARRRISGCKWPAPRYVIGIIKELLSKRFYLEWATRNRNRLGQKRPKLSTIGSFFVPSLFSTSLSSSSSSKAA